MKMPPAGTRLCSLAALEATGAKGVDLECDGERFCLFVVAGGDAGVCAYMNQCPHIGTPLDMLPDRFPTRDRKLILCSTHGARFRIEDGLCVSGPCRGQSLTPVAVAVMDGAACIAPEAGGTAA